MRRAQAHTDAIKVFEATNIDRWPYTKVLGVTVVDPTLTIMVRDELAWPSQRNGATFRVYTEHPHSFVEWGLVEPYTSGPAYELTDCLAPDQMHLATAAPWLEIRYTPFQSSNAKDRARLHRLHERAVAGTVSAFGFPDGLAPRELSRQYAASPHSDWHMNAEFHGKEVSALWLTPRERDDIPVINAHTIPKGFAYEYVSVWVTDFRQYAALPTYGDILQTQRAYDAWFRSLAD